MHRIEKIQATLETHQVYSKLTSISNLDIFMQYHVFAVFDFMSLLKSLQSKIAPANCVWTPSQYSPKVVRFINEIVIAEESDITPSGAPLSHFELYLSAMNELNISSDKIKSFVDKIITLNEYDFELIPDGVREFVEYNLYIAKNGSIEEVLGAFLFGREKLIPQIFSPILKVLESEFGKNSLVHFYFARHIEIDSDEHGPMAQLCFEEICKTDDQKEIAFRTAEQSLKLRLQLWDSISNKINEINEINA